MDVNLVDAEHSAVESLKLLIRSDLARFPSVGGENNILAPDIRIVDNLGSFVETPCRDFVLLDRDFICRFIDQNLFVRTVVLHEWYHNVMHNIHSYAQALTLISAFGEGLIVRIDVETDLEVFSFLHEIESLSFGDHVKEVLHPALRCFSHQRGKPFDAVRCEIERLLGSILSLGIKGTTGASHVVVPSLMDFQVTKEGSEGEVELTVYGWSNAVRFGSCSLARRDVQMLVSVAQQTEIISPTELLDLCLRLVETFSKNWVFRWEGHVS